MFDERLLFCGWGYLAEKMVATKSISSLVLVDSSSCFFSPIPRFLTLRIATTTALRSAATFTLRRSPSHRSLTPSLAVMFPDNSVLSDVCASGITSVVAVSCLGFWGEIGKRGFFDQVPNNNTISHESLSE